MFLHNISHCLRVYLVMDLSEFEGRSAIDTARDAIEGGVTVIQLREKKAPLSLVMEKGREIRQLCREKGVPFLVNDRIDVALLLEVDGVHIGQDDLPGSEARKLLGPDKIIGISAGSMEEARWAVSQGADYLGVGAIYATLTKDDAGSPVGTALIRTMKEQWPDMPVVGIGGIDASNAASVIESGADGVAVVSAITKQKDAKEAAGRLIGIVRGN